MTERKQASPLGKAFAALIILGLLAGAVMVGSSLIHVAETRMIITEKDYYLSAIASFRVKYGALPGDMTNAENIWGSDAQCPNTPSNTVVKNETCNGNGDGNIANGNSGEAYRAWQQLANAGLITGRYTGVLDIATGLPSFGISNPASKIHGAGWAYTYSQNTYMSRANAESYNVIAIGDTSSEPIGSQRFTNREAYAVDTKIDDAVPQAGDVRGEAGNECGGLSYNLNYRRPDCVIYFKLVAE